MLQIIGSSKAWIVLADQALLGSIAVQFLMFDVSFTSEISVESNLEETYK